MNDRVIPTYYGITQLCDRWHFDLRQIRDVISKKAIPLYAYITGKKGGAFNQKVRVCETKINTATGDDLQRFGNLTHEELEEQGFIIKSVEPNLYQVHKGTMRFLIDNSGGLKKVRIPALRADAFDVLHDGFIELCDEHSIDPSKSLTSLFENEELLTVIIKSKKDGHVRFLEPACGIKLEDIYIHYTDVHRVEQQTTTIPHQNTEYIDAVINNTLKTDLNILLRKTFPEYSGQIAKKTSAPNALLIKVMVMMQQLQHQDITWTTIREFIEEHIYGNHERAVLAKLNSIDDNAIIVNDRELINTNASRRVSEYKNKFGINQ